MTSLGLIFKPCQISCFWRVDLNFSITLCTWNGMEIMKRNQSIKKEQNLLFKSAAEWRRLNKLVKSETWRLVWPRLENKIGKRKEDEIRRIRSGDVNSSQFTLIAEFLFSSEFWIPLVHLRNFTLLGILLC